MTGGMTPERWARIKEVFGEALERDYEERRLYLDAECAGDEPLRAEVERLLSTSAETLESPVEGVLRRAVAPELEKGSMLAHYRVETKIGQGGMGAVYKAYDTRLDRRVALKILATPGSDQETNFRVLREARAASALAHPHIVTVHDVGHDRNVDYIAMELVDGRSLEELIPATGYAPRQALNYAIQIAEALSSAHEAGVIHRDLKPANVMVGRDGAVKLLDFGLARRARAGESTPGEGRLAGTPCYMSPEQVRGAALDARSDLFSFGLVLFRLLTGQDAFDRGSASGTLDAIVSDEPAELPTGRMPYALERVVGRCLEKDPAHRFQSARDIAYALEALGGPREELPAEPPPGPKRRPWLVPLVVALALTAGVAGTKAWIGSHREQLALDGHLYAQLSEEAGAELFPALSPDGTSVVYASKARGNWDLYRRTLGGSDAVNLTADCAEDDTQPAWSPDGQRLVFRSGRDGGGLFLLELKQGKVHRLTNGGFNPEFSPDGRRVVFAEEGVTRPEDRTARLSHLWVVEVSGGEPRQVTKDDGVQPSWSPDGKAIAYWGIDLDGDRDLRVIPAGGGETVRLTRDHFVDWNPVWSPDSTYLYFLSNRGGSMGLWRLPMKDSGLEARGNPEPVRVPAAYPAHLRFAAHKGRLAYTSLAATGRLEGVRLEPETGVVTSEPKLVLTSSKGIARPDLSPDGGWLAFNSTEQEELLYVVAADGSGLRQLTSGAARHRGPRWSPDGHRLAFFSDRSGEWEIWSADVTTGAASQLTALEGQNVAWPVWSTDGRTLAYTVFGVHTFLLDALQSWKAQKPRPLPTFPQQGKQFSGWRWSPDGTTLAGFLNNNDGVALFNLAKQTFEPLTREGSDPVWLSDNRRLLYWDRGRIHLVDRESKVSRELVSLGAEEVARRGFALSADNRYLYFSVSSTESDVWMIDFER